MATRATDLLEAVHAPVSASARVAVCSRAVYGKMCIGRQWLHVQLNCRRRCARQEPLLVVVAGAGWLHCWGRCAHQQFPGMQNRLDG